MSQDVKPLVLKWESQPETESFKGDFRFDAPTKKVEGFSEDKLLAAAVEASKSIQSFPYLPYKSGETPAPVKTTVQPMYGVVASGWLERDRYACTSDAATSYGESTSDAFAVIHQGERGHYPKWLYASGGRSCVVQTLAEQRHLGPGWYESPDLVGK